MDAVDAASDEPVVPVKHEVEEPVMLGAPEELGVPEAGVDAALEADEALAADVPVVDEKAAVAEVGMAKDKPSVPPTE